MTEIGNMSGLVKLAGNKFKREMLYFLLNYTYLMVGVNCYFADSDFCPFFVPIWNPRHCLSPAVPWGADSHVLSLLNVMFVTCGSRPALLHAGALTDQLREPSADFPPTHSRSCSLELVTEVDDPPLGIKPVPPLLPQSDSAVNCTLKK